MPHKSCEFSELFKLKWDVRRRSYLRGCKFSIYQLPVGTTLKWVLWCVAQIPLQDQGTHSCNCWESLLLKAQNRVLPGNCSWVKEEYLPWFHSCSVSYDWLMWDTNAQLSWLNWDNSEIPFSVWRSLRYCLKSLFVNSLQFNLFLCTMLFLSPPTAVPSPINLLYVNIRVSEIIFQRWGWWGWMIQEMEGS